MKKIIKGKWFPTIAAIGILTLATGVVLTMMLFGWRITYAPHIKNNWDAISAVAAWTGVVISAIAAIASFTAVLSAIHISDKQNRISLFEKRFSAYQILCQCVIFSDRINGVQDKINFKICFINSFSYPSTIEDCSLLGLNRQVGMYFPEVCRTLEAAMFLFDCNTDGYFQPIIEGLKNLVYSGNNIAVICLNKEKYLAAINKMKKELLPLIEEELSLQK